MTRRIRLMAGAACIALIAGMAACSQQEERDTSGTSDPSERGKETAQTTTLDDGTVVIQPYPAPATEPELSRDEGLASGAMIVAESPSNQIGYAPTPVNAGERYAELDEAGVFAVAEAPVSTFSVDVDTGAYANIRRMLNAGYLPPEDAVRIEELINYFDYGYAAAPDADHPFSINTAVARTPWNEDTYLLQVGLKGFEPAAEERPAANLVFLVDVSGSMEPQDKLPLVKSALRLLVNELRPEDSVALVTYAGS
ncbi:MAG: von Willebrand factor type A domain-containing protein, partial [Dongiaceae bacterium]